MGTLIRQQNGAETGDPVRCPICAHPNEPMRYCRHVRWTFDQGGPIEFARFALETSPYVQARGGKPRDIPKNWWDEKGPWIVDMVMIHLDAFEGYVFGELSDVDMLARDLWRDFHPEPEHPQMQRVDPV